MTSAIYHVSAIREDHDHDHAYREPVPYLDRIVRSYEWRDPEMGHHRPLFVRCIVRRHANGPIEARIQAMEHPLRPYLSVIANSERQAEAIVLDIGESLKKRHNGRRIGQS